jgi:opacity protein-like surface antigen
MTRRITPLVPLAALLLGSAAPASAQVLGLVVRNAGVPAGIGIAAEAGFANTDYGKGQTFGGTGQVGLGALGFTVTIASYNPDAAGTSSTTSYGGTANLKVFGGPLVPFSVTLQAGYGYADASGVKHSHVPVGLGLALNIPNPSVAIRPWIAPRADINEASGAGLPSDTKTRFALSGGIDFNLLNGFGAGVSYDWIDGDGGTHPGIFGARLHYVFNVPGL